MIETQEQLATNIHISIDTEYLSSQSDPDDDRYVFSYTITITNHTASNIQLLHRHWLITDANGETTEVHGEGVVGKQPQFKPGSKFTYSSGSILKTPIGTMQGFYEFKDENGSLFKAEIPVFRLAIPNILN